jgi:DNA-binding FrmR family transcriptional regulator
MSTLRDAEKKRTLCARLARVEGQLRGIQKLIEDEADCEKVAQQLSAARKALDKTFYAMLGCMIEEDHPSAAQVSDMLVKFA